MTEKTLSDDNPVEVSKIVSIIENPGEEVELLTFYDHFDGFSDNEITAIVHNVLLSAIKVLHKSADKIRNIDETAPIPINKGSLYDDVVFECGVYVSGDNTVYTNANFGSSCEETATYIEGLEHVSVVIGLLVKKLENGEKIPQPED